MKILPVAVTTDDSGAVKYAVLSPSWLAQSILVGYVTDGDSNALLPQML